MGCGIHKHYSEVWYCCEYVQSICRDLRCGKITRRGNRYQGTHLNCTPTQNKSVRSLSFAKAPSNKYFTYHHIYINNVSMSQSMQVLYSWLICVMEISCTVNMVQARVYNCSVALIAELASRWGPKPPK